MYNGHYLAARDVLVVVPNYRMNIYGFATTGDDVTPGNMGLHDQKAALEWVRDNAALFGGNPDRVTIFGQSAGAASAGHHVMSPLSTGLFHAVIQQSGCESNFWSINWPPQQPWTYTQQAAERFGCPVDDNRAMMDCLKTIPAEDLAGNQSVTCTPGSFCMGHQPVIDGEFIIDNPLVLRENGNFTDVPIFSGYNREDGSLYLIGYVPEALERGFNRSEFMEYVYTRLVAIWAPQFSPEEVQKVYDSLIWFYTPWPYIDDLDMNRQAMNDMITDAAWGYTTDRMLRIHSERNPSYMYVFAYRSTNTSDGIWEDTEWAGVPHSGEIPYVWGWPLLRLDPEVRRDSRIFIDVVDWTPDDFAYAEFFMDLFTNFAKTFNPTPEPVTPPGDLPDLTYPLFTPTEARYVLIDNGNVSPDMDYRQREAAYFREYFAYLSDTPISQYSSNKEVKRAGTKPLEGHGFDPRVMQEAINTMVKRIVSQAQVSDVPDVDEDWL